MNRNIKNSFNYIITSFASVGLILVIVLFAYSIYSTTTETLKFKNNDSFYRTYSDFDEIRFPLIKPFEAEKVDNSDSGWYISLDDLDNDIGTSNSIMNIKKIAIENGIIMAYTPKNNILNIEGKVVFHWFVIDPNKKETGFNTEESFLSYIAIYNIKKPNWVDPELFFHQFHESGCLDWIPGCNQQ